MFKSLNRKIIQISAAIATNSQVLNLLSGKLYKGQLKNFCSPGLHCYSCPAAAFSCPIGALQTIGGSLYFKFSFYVTGFLLLIGLLIGRAVCGFLCPFGLFQELVYKVPLPKINLWRPLIYVKYVILLVFVLLMPVLITDYAGTGAPAFCEYICPAGTLEAAIPMLITHSEFRSAAGSLFVLKMFILAITVGGCTVIYRFFCKVLCPLGAIYGLLNKISLYRIKIDNELCINCGQCYKSCPMSVNPVKNPDSAECIRCGICISTCPKKAINNEE
ncbi:MAG: 4Fe-4S binding protein [Selenomonadaceae bacterium]|nr:4Fe-4S binding protein [Selenomonadaceae bacterium]